jgi:membrane protease YdiL (CAAX protease family)
MESRRALFEAFAAYAVFCAVTFLIRYLPLAMPVMALGGIAFPLAWGKSTGRWAEMGFTRRNAAAAVCWGVGTGLVTSLIGFLTVQERSLAPDLGLELAVGIPMWLLFASPFQEFFFRGWLQPRYERRWGERMGLFAATVGFTAWHYFLPIFGPSAQSTFPVYTLPGLAGTFAAGLIYGYGFQCTRSIVTPWLAHALTGIMFAVIGSASLFPNTP